jgi:rhodanese-related sulfurtransferase
MRLFRRHSVSVQRARELLAEGWQVVDVRTAKEWKSHHVTGAFHIPLDTLERSLGRLSKSDSIVTICHSGLRSAVAARTLRSNGWNAVTVRGGMMAWNRR